MMRLVISFAVALAVSTGAATGVAVKRNKEAAAVVAAQQKAKADSIRAVDSTQVAERVIEDPRDSLAKHDTAAVAVDSTKRIDSTHTPVTRVAAAAQPAPSVPLGLPAAVKPGAAPAAASKPANDTAVVTLSEKRIAKAFASMPPRDAAKVFEVMSDADVGAILSSLSDKESAAILSKLPPERVASISRASLRGRGGTK